MTGKITLQWRDLTPAVRVGQVCVAKCKSLRRNAESECCSQPRMDGAVGSIPKIDSTARTTTRRWVGPDEDEVELEDAASDGLGGVPMLRRLSKTTRQTRPIANHLSPQCPPLNHTPDHPTTPSSIHPVPPDCKLNSSQPQCLHCLRRTKNSERSEPKAPRPWQRVKFASDSSVLFPPLACVPLKQAFRRM